ncbi:FUSC family protein [Streptomyces sp. NPDC044948]|uniref:FUSC family protein n=1 Tax=Streptomyces sp. NPDC044948 TaxID=3157092 RepID=UPI0033E11151
MSAAVASTAHRWRSGLTSFDRRRAARSMVVFGLSFGAVTAVGGIHHGIFAAMGCYVDAYGAREPYPRRGPLLVLLSASFLVAFVAGSAAAGDVWAMVGVLTVVAVAATLLVRTLRVSGPGSYFVILVASLAAFLPPVTPADTAVRAGCLALGAVLSCAATMSGWLSRPYEPEERAVSAAFRSVARFAEAQREHDAGQRSGAGTGSGSGNGNGAGGTARDARGALLAAGQSAYVAAHGAWVALDNARKGRGAGTAPEPAPRRLALYALMTRLEALLDTVQNATERGGAPVSPDRVAWLRTAATDIAAGRVPGPSPDGHRTWREPMRAARALWPAPLPPRETLRTELSRPLSRSSPDLPVALRIGLAVAVGTVLGSVLPLLHPAWVAVGAAAALQGGPGRQPAQRARVRFLGTLTGVGVTALAFHSYQPGTWVTVTVVTAAHAVSRGAPPGALFVRTMLSTPVALLLVATVVPDGLGRLAAFRLLDLTLGLVLGLAATLVLAGVPGRRVCAAVANAVQATGTAVRERLRTGEVRPGCEGTAWQRTAELWDMNAAVPAEEVRTTGTADRLWPAVLAVRRLLSWTVLAGPAPPAPDEAVRVGRHLDALARAAAAGLPGSSAVREALPGPPPVTPPAPAHAAELHRRLVALADALVRPDPTPESREGTGGQGEGGRS